MDPVAVGIVVAVLLALAVVLALLFYTVPARRKPERGAVDAFHLLLRGRTTEARRLLTELVKSGEAPAEAYLELGRLLRDAGEPQRAFALHQGILVRPQLSSELRRLTELALAEDLIVLGRVAEATQRLRDLDARLVDGDVLALRARAHHLLGEREAAAKALEQRGRLLEADMRDAAAYFAEIGRESLGEGHYDTARQRARRAHKLWPKLAAGYVVEGDAEIAQGREDAAQKAWAAGLHACEEGRTPLLARWVEQAFQQGRLERAVEELELLRTERPDDPALWRAVADLRLRRGDLESFFLLIEDPPERAEIDLGVAANWFRHILAHGSEEQAQRLLRTLPNAFGPRVWQCSRCRHEEAEPRECCMKCGQVAPLKPAATARRRPAAAVLMAGEEPS